jgi:hypothetical protein
MVGFGVGFGGGGMVSWDLWLPWASAVGLGQILTPEDHCHSPGDFGGLCCLSKTQISNIWPHGGHMVANIGGGH